MNMFRKSGFTLIELMMVIVIIAIIAGLAFPAFMKLRMSARKEQSRKECTSLASAIRTYYHEYGRYPCDEGSGGIKRFISDNNKVIEYLTTFDSDKNFRQVYFINESDYRLDNRKVVDPLGHPYEIVIDIDNDTIDVSIDYTLSPQLK